MRKLCIALCLLSTASALAGAEGVRDHGIDSSWLHVGGNVNLDYFARSNQDYSTNLRIMQSQIELSADLAKGIRAVLETEFTRYLIKHGVQTSGYEFDLAEFIDEAYIEVKMDEITGAPVVFVMGKGKQAFGQYLSRLPMFKDNLLYEGSHIEEVIGFTIKLNKFAFGSVLEASVFENSEGDFKIGNAGGASVRLSKQITDRIKGVASLALIGKDSNYDWSDMQKRAALSFIYKSADGRLRAFVGGLYMENVEEFTGTQWGVQTGIAVKAGPGDVVVEYAFLESVAHQLALAYNIRVNENLLIAPELSHYFNTDGTQETRLGVRARVDFADED